MADDKKNIGPEAEKPGEDPQEKKVEPVKDTPPAPEQPAPGAPQAPVVEAAPKAQPAPTVESQPEEKAAPAPKVLDFSAAKNKAPGKEEAVPEKKPVKEQAVEKPKRGRPAKADKAAPAEKPRQPRDKMSQSKKAPGKEAPIPQKAEEVPKEAKAPEQEQPTAPRDTIRSAESEQIVYINLSELHPFKNHPFGVRDDSEMKGPVELVKVSGVNQTALVRPREDGGYEIIAGHRRQKASELDKEGKLNPDVIDGILSQEKKKEDRNVIIDSAERKSISLRINLPMVSKELILFSHLHELPYTPAKA